MNRSAFFTLLPLLCGCGVRSNQVSNGSDSVSIQADENGQIAFDLPFAKGNVKLPRSIIHNGNIDLDGVRLMPGSSVTGFNMRGGDHGADVNMTFTAQASPDQVRSYFADQFRRQGIKVTLAGDSISGQSKDGSPFTIEITPARAGSQGKILIHGETTHGDRS